MNKNDLDRLVELGISRKEVDVYIVLLKADKPVSIVQISRITRLNRTSLYAVLNRLIQRELVIFVKYRSSRRYIAATPDKLAHHVREEVNKFTLLRQNLLALLPEMRAQHKGAKFKPQVTLSKGTEGLRKAFDEALVNQEKVMRVSSSVENIFFSLPEYLPFFVKERLKRGIKMYGIHPNDKLAREMLMRVPNNLDELALLSPQRFKFPSDFAIYDNKITIMNHKLSYFVCIESLPIANVMKVAFDLAHREAKRLDTQPAK